MAHASPPSAACPLSCRFSTPVVFAERRGKEASGWVQYLPREHMKTVGTSARVTIVRTQGLSNPPGLALCSDWSSFRALLLGQGANGVSLSGAKSGSLIIAPAHLGTHARALQHPGLALCSDWSSVRTSAVL